MIFEDIETASLRYRWLITYRTRKLLSLGFATSAVTRLLHGVEEDLLTRCVAAAVVQRTFKSLDDEKRHQTLLTGKQS